MLSDAELVRRMIGGEEQAFGELYQRHQGAVYRFALLMTGSANLAEDVVQEVFLELIRELERYDPSRGAFGSYLFGIARNHVRRRIVRERPYVQLVGDTGEETTDAFQMIDRDDPFINYARSETTTLVRQAVLALPSRYREVVVLCDFQGWTHTDAAAALNCPLGTINSRLHRAHSLLLKKLRKTRSLAVENHLRCIA